MLGKEQLEVAIDPNQGRIEPLLFADRDYRGLRIVQAQALTLFSHFMSDGNLGNVIRRYVGEECYSRSQILLESHLQNLGMVFNHWNGTNRDDLFYPLFEVDKAELAAAPSDTFLTGNEIGHELFAGRQLDHVVGFDTADYGDFQTSVANYLLQQLSRIYFLNPEVRVGAAARRRFATDEGRELAYRNLDKGRLARGLLPYSEEDTQALIRLWLDGTSLKEIAGSIGRTVPAIKFQIGKLNLPGRRDLRPWTDEETADMLALKQQRHLTNDQIAEILNRSEEAVHRRLIANDVVSFHRKPWEAEEFQRLQELLKTEYSWATVQQRLATDFPKNRTPRDVQAKAIYTGLALKTEFEVKRARFEQMLAAGLPDKEIAERLGITSVGRWKKRLQAEKEGSANQS